MACFLRSTPTFIAMAIAAIIAKIFAVHAVMTAAAAAMRPTSYTMPLRGASILARSSMMTAFTTTSPSSHIGMHQLHQQQSLHSKRRMHMHQFITTAAARRTVLFSSSSDDYYDDNDDGSDFDDATATNNNIAIAPPPSFESYFDPNSFSSSASLRAGEDGYSLLRRPITSSASSFGSDDPVFDAPRLLDSIEERRRNEDVNRIWFEEQRRIQPQRSIVSSTSTVETATTMTMGSTSSTAGTASGGTMMEPSNVDLHKRTVDTLDYHSVLRALSEECTSAFGKRLVVSSSPAATSSYTVKSTTSTDDDDNDEEEDVLTMPLSASSVQGVHRRYNAVREMERLMDMENGVIRHDYVITPGSGCGNSDLRQKQRQRRKLEAETETGTTANDDKSNRYSETNNDRDKNKDKWRSKQGGSTNNQDSGNKRKTPKVKQPPLGLPPISGRTLDLQPILRIIDDGEVLEGPEILDVTSMLELSLEVLDWAEALYEVNDYEQRQQLDMEDENADDIINKLPPFVELPKLVQSMHVDDELLRILSNAFEEGTGRLDGTTFPSLGRLRASIRFMKRDILETVDSILAKPSMRDKLAVESGGALTMEINGRLVIPIQRKYQMSVGGIVHDASRSGKTCYVEPTEITGPTNELRRAEAELRSEESRIWRELTEMIDKHRPSIERNVACLGQLDVVLARAKLGRRLSGVIPNVGTEGVVHVCDAKHPVLLLRGLGKDAVVGSDVDLGRGKNQGLILTGPNSGGKTIILKLLGLYAFMVRDGIPIPSKPDEPARVDFFSPILADIGDMQSVDGDLSTFSGHMLVCREVLKNAGRDALVLMDELGSGTDPNQGVAIARALLEALLDRGCRVAITTHYLELKQLASTDDRFDVAGMQFVNGRPTYKLLPGVIGESFALAVAERLELPDTVIRRAYELLDTETRQMGELIRDLEDQKLIVDQKNEELQRREYEMLEMMAEMKKQQQKLEMTQLTARREEARKFAAKLEEKERLLDDILEKLKGSGATKKVVAESWSDIRIVKREALAEAENIPGVMSRLKQQLNDQAEDYELIPISEKGNVSINVDDKVIVCKKGAFYGKEGVVKEVGKKIQVIVGGVPVRLTTSEIAFPPSTGRPQSNLYEESVAEGRGGGRTMSKMAQRALDLDSSADSPVDIATSSSSSTGDRGATFKMKSNTVDCIGMNFEESKRKCIDAFSKAVMQNRSAVYILHGHGTGVLKKKIRSWLQGDRQWVKTFRPADQADGGDAFTLVELKKQKLF